MAEHQAADEAQEAEQKAEQSWCAAEAERAKQVEARSEDCGEIDWDKSAALDAKAREHHDAATLLEQDGREQTAYGWTSASRPELAAPSTCGGCTKAPCNCPKPQCYKDWHKTVSSLAK